MARTTITTTQPGYVTLSYDDEFGNRITREFFCSDKPAAYVREWRKDGNHTQPCGALSRTGSTLMCDGYANLLAVIRREYRAMRRAEK
jgi:hypothetical protein